MATEEIHPKFTSVSTYMYTSVWIPIPTFINTHTPKITALGLQEEDLHEFKAAWSTLASFRPGRTT